MAAVLIRSDGGLVSDEPRGEGCLEFDGGVGFRVSRNLVSLRRRKGLTQQELASLAGVSRATVHLIEAGEGDPRFSTLGLLAKGLGVDVIELAK